MKAAEIKRRAEEKGYEIYRERGKTVVVFPNGKDYRYADSLTDVAQRIGLISEAERTQVRNSDQRHARVIVGYKFAGQNYSVKDDWSRAYFDQFGDSADKPTVYRLVAVGMETIEEVYM
jgi:hypothetical protein